MDRLVTYEGGLAIHYRPLEGNWDTGPCYIPCFRPTWPSHSVFFWQVDWTQVGYVRADKSAVGRKYDLFLCFLCGSAM